MKYTNIVFDIDGTLINSEYASLKSLQITLRDYGINVTTEALSFTVSLTSINALKRFNIKDISAAIKKWGENMDKLRNTISVFDGVAELLQTLRQAKYGLGIVTANTKSEYTQDFGVFGLADYFTVAVCAEDTLEHKPSPAPLIKYSELVGAQKSKTIYIGDTADDMLCASNAGVDFALACWGAAQKDINAKIRLNKPADLLNFL